MAQHSNHYEDLHDQKTLGFCLKTQKDEGLNHLLVCNYE